MITIDDLKNLCIKTGKKLISMGEEGKMSYKDAVPSSKLIFPNYRAKDEQDMKRRVSEQESRFAFAHAVEESNLDCAYTIETPTDHKYSFGEKLKIHTEEDSDGQSAMLDMSLFNKENDKYSQKINIEFKAHNPEAKSITKDILKLMIEEQDGLFFHLLEKADNNTLLYYNLHKDVKDLYKNENALKDKEEGEPIEVERIPEKGIIDKYILGIKQAINLTESHETDRDIWKERYITFAIVILQFEILLLKTIRKSELLKVDHLGLLDFSYVTYKPRKRDDRDFVILDDNNWRIFNLQESKPKFKYFEYGDYDLSFTPKVEFDQIIRSFLLEFGPEANKFKLKTVIEGKGNFTEDKLKIATHIHEDKDIIWHPGVYLFYGNKMPYRVGRHLTNARKRTIEHIKDNTGEAIHELNQYDDSKLLLFNLIDPDDYHFAAALEIFLENKLKRYLRIPAKREG